VCSLRKGHTFSDASPPREPVLDVSQGRVDDGGGRGAGHVSSCNCNPIGPERRSVHENHSRHLETQVATVLSKDSAERADVPDLSPSSALVALDAHNSLT
jgi:hypothetical protein